MSWTARESNRLWISVASSADGSRLVAVAYDGKIYSSADGGVTWTERDAERPWYSVASSADGSKLVAVLNGGRIYTSTPFTTPGADGSISGGVSDAIELRYLGNGTFTVLSHEGNLRIQ